MRSTQASDNVTTEKRRPVYDSRSRAPANSKNNGRKRNGQRNLSTLERHNADATARPRAKPESTEGGRRVSVLKRQEGAPVLLG